ncbi:hypothetical protein H4R18_000510 [Coemansia javaensis]|uniref:Uncharacterized protein n=1 Tax=Coemansia javaensis TaxID=2761396 RepID=A0A9W8LMN6_9FUNG|nr:hypothetical protein H4R18_000510 [Coemansia javaensis]
MRFPWKLRFPKLRNINMFCTDSVLPLLECATLPSHVDSIRIYAAAPVLQCVSGLALPATRRIEIGTDGRGGNTVNGDGVAMVAAACRILEKAQGAKELALVIGDSWPRVQPEHITFTSITELRISPSANMDAMLGLLQRLPKLVNVWFDSFDAETVDVDLLLPGPDEGCAVEPLHASIKKMEVYSIDSAASRENSAAVVNYLLLKIPTLARLNAHRTLSAPVLQFVKAYSEQHPRLSRVKLRLCNEED